MGERELEIEFTEELSLGACEAGFLSSTHAAERVAVIDKVASTAMDKTLAMQTTGKVYICFEGTPGVRGVLDPLKTVGRSRLAEFWCRAGVLGTKARENTHRHTSHWSDG